jgi:DNA-binding response OmpR family regulator
MKLPILIADDNEEILEFLIDDLNHKYTIFTAHNGKEALDILNTETIQLVITDIMMPVMDGFELCKAIKSHFYLSHIPVIMLTVKNTLQFKIEGLELGADAYIDKPFSPEHLNVQIANLLSNRDKVKKYFANAPLASIKTMAHSKTDEKFLDELNKVICEHIEDTDLDVELLAKCMNMSRPTLYRKIKAISDLTPNELINISRLKKAAELVVTGKYKISEIASMVGYSSQTNFGRNFLKQFGLTPTHYMELKQAECRN